MYCSGLVVTISNHSKKTISE